MTCENTMVTTAIPASASPAATASRTRAAAAGRRRRRPPAGDRHRAGGQARGGQPGMPGPARNTAGGRGQRNERGDAGDDGQDRGPGGPAQPAARPQPDHGHAEQQRRGDQQLHDRQRAGAQRDRVGGESAELDGDAEQPPRALHQQQEQPGTARRLSGRRGRLALLQPGTGSVKDGRGQRPDQGRHRTHRGSPPVTPRPAGPPPLKASSLPLSLRTATCDRR